MPKHNSPGIEILDLLLKGLIIVGFIWASYNVNGDLWAQ